MNDITALIESLKEPAKQAIELGHIKNYAKGRHAVLLFQSRATAANVLALVEALEKTQKSNEFLKDQLSELANFNPDWDKLEASYESWREIAAELLVAKDRIALMESRTVTVKFEPIPVEQLGNVKDGKKHPYMFGAGYNCAVVHCESVMLQALAAAGIQVIEGEA